VIAGHNKTMAELLIVNLDKLQFTVLHRAAARGDPQARDAVIHMFDEWRDREINCFLCNSADCQPPYAQILPERNDYQLLAVGLCIECRDLPVMQKMGRCLRALRKMWGTKAFHFNIDRQPHPR
jgi:hypothetical protein